ncbi:MAG: glycosyltransferase [Deltaproteobacteria bacterium]
MCKFNNTYQQQIGGVARSVNFFSQDLCNLGHRVLVIAPTYAEEADFKDKQIEVLRVPAIQHFKGSDFSMRIPLPFIIDKKIDAFKPDVIHSHHPYLLGDAALRAARRRRLPLIYTHHTLYEKYTHYVPLDSEQLQQFVIRLSTQYANFCTKVIAPSRSIAELIAERGVHAPIEEIPTGVDIRFFARGRGRRFRRAHNLSEDALIIGHLGRLAPEKNLDFLAESVAIYLKDQRKARFLVVGSGPSEADIRRIFETKGVAAQLLMAGSKTGDELADAYRAMNAFVFASQSETQGMVLTEAMACGLPVIALDASGVREVVVDRQNGRLLPPDATCRRFADAISEVVNDPDKANQWGKQARQTAEKFSREICARRLAQTYQSVVRSRQSEVASEELIPWDRLLEAVRVEWDLFFEKTAAAAKAIRDIEQSRKNKKQKFPEL